MLDCLFTRRANVAKVDPLGLCGIKIEIKIGITTKHLLQLPLGAGGFDISCVSDSKVKTIASRTHGLSSIGQ